MELENTSLTKLAEQLPNFIIHCREDNTIKKYHSSFNVWKLWAKTLRVSEIPAKPFTIALFILNRIQMDDSFTKIEGIFYSIKFYHKLLGYSDPCGDSMVISMLEAAKRICCHKINKKKPITVEHLRNLYDKLIEQQSSLLNIRTMTICILGFSGFMRYSEISNLKLSDIVFCDTHLKLFIEKSKTDIYRDGSWIFISKSDSRLCPVSNLKLYLDTAGIQEDDEYIFRAVTKTKKSQYLRKSNKPLSYSRMREILLTELENIGLDKNLFGLHSLRSGGATAAANAGVPDRLFKRHGRWKSDRAKDGYVEDNLNVLLSVSKTLGL